MRLFLLFSMTLLSSYLQLQAQKSPAIPSRANSYWGLHFDFHATLNDKEIGASLDEKATLAFLKLTKPDYITVDVKGHGGISSYPTKVGVSPQMKQNPLSFYRKVTASLGIGLYGHYSGIVDRNVLSIHPNWGRLGQLNEKDAENVSMFSSYLEDVQIPQLKELSNSGMDGVMIDGEVWSLYSDYNQRSLNLYGKQFKSLSKPMFGDNANYKNFLLFQEKEYLKYLSRYLSAIHQLNRRFQVGVNWAYTSIMPFSVNTGIDFLTADMPQDKDIHSLELEVRFLSSHLKPWDILIWGFNDTGPKPESLIQRDIFTAVSRGGGFQLYYVQNRDASLPVHHAAKIKKLSDFAMAFKSSLFKSSPVTEVAILYPYESMSDYKIGIYKNIPGVHTIVTTLLSALLDKHYQVDILQEDKIAANAKKYSVLIMAGWKNVTHKTIQGLRKYLQQGGRLIVGGGATQYFKSIESGQNLRLLNTDANIAAEVPKILAAKKLDITGSPIPIRAILSKQGNALIISLYSLTGNISNKAISFSVEHDESMPVTTCLSTESQQTPFKIQNGRIHITINAKSLYETVTIK